MPFNGPSMGHHQLTVGSNSDPCTRVGNSYCDPRVPNVTHVALRLTRTSEIYGINVTFETGSGY
eukprot:2062993-Rhodomonas_salina.1